MAPEQQKDTNETILLQKRFRSKKLNRAVHWGKIFFTPVAIGFLAYYAWQSRQNIAVIANNANIWHLEFALIGWALIHFVSPIFAVLILNGSGSVVTYEVALRIHIVNLPGKYIPGGVWHTVSRVVDYKFHGVTSSRIALFVFLENVLAPAVTLGAGGACLWYFLGFRGWGAAGAVGMMLGLFAMLVFPIIVNWSKTGPNKRLSMKIYIKSLGIVAIFWTIAAGAFVTYVFAFPAAAENLTVFKVAGAYLFSWGIGYISFFAPQGIGVFEAVAGGIMAGKLPLGSLVALIASFRILVLVADILAWAGYKIYTWKRKEIAPLGVQ